MRHRHQTGLVLAGLLLVAAACGGDDDADEPATASNPATSADATPATGSAAGAGTATTAPASTGETDATDESGSTNPTSDASGIEFSETNEWKADVDRSGETIRIGVSNNEGPTFSNPEMRTGMLTAIDFINENGGVNGATLEPVVCVSDATPESAIDCANQFIEQDVALVTYGAEVGMDAAMPIYEEAGIAVISDFAYNQTPTDNVWALSSPLGSFALYGLQAMKDAGASKVAYMLIDTPVHRAQADLVKQWGELTGIDTVDAPVVDPSAGDWTSAVQTVLGQGADALINYGPTTHVQAMIKAARQLGFEGPIITTDQEYINALGAPDALNTYVIFARYPSSDATGEAPQRIRDNVAAYEKAMTDAGHADLINGNAHYQFAATLEIASILEMIPDGPINLETISQALSEDRNIIGFDSADFNCGAHPWPADPRFCRAYQLVLEVVDQGGELVQVPSKDENFGFYNDPDLNAQSASLGG